MSYDGNRKSCWTQCVWQPREIRNEITLMKIEMLNDLAQDLMAMSKPVRVIRNKPGKPLTPEQLRQLGHRGYR